MGVIHEADRSVAGSNNHVWLAISILLHIPLTNLLLRSRVDKQIRFHVLNVQVDGKAPLFLQGLADLAVGERDSRRRSSLVIKNKDTAGAFRPSGSHRP